MLATLSSPAAIKCPPGWATFTSEPTPDNEGYLITFQGTRDTSLPELRKQVADLDPWKVFKEFMLHDNAFMASAFPSRNPQDMKVVRIRCKIAHPSGADFAVTSGFRAFSVNSLLSLLEKWLDEQAKDIAGANRYAKVAKARTLSGIFPQGIPTKVMGMILALKKAGLTEKEEYVLHRLEGGYLIEYESGMAEVFWTLFKVNNISFQDCKPSKKAFQTQGRGGLKVLDGFNGCDC